MVNNPGFSKIYMPSLGEENMKIPRNIIQMIQKTCPTPTSVTLRDQYANLWQVKVQMVGDDWYLEDGWTQFISNNRVEEGDMLTYEYFSGDLLDFKVHGSSTSMTKGVGGPVTDVTYDDNDNDADSPTTHEGNQEDNEAIDGVASTRRSKRKRDFNRYGDELFKSGLVPQPENDYFVTQKRSYRPNELYVPMDMIKIYGPTPPARILLIDPHGREFHSTRKRTFYVGGWGALCKINRVKDGDSCICEFVQRGQDLCIRVTFPGQQ